MDQPTQVQLRDTSGTRREVFDLTVLAAVIVWWHGRLAVLTRHGVFVTRENAAGRKAAEHLRRRGPLAYQVSGLLKVMGTFLRAITIMTVGQASGCSTTVCAIDPADTLTPNSATVDTINAGSEYGKNGRENESTARTAQCVAFHLPSDMETGSA